MTGILRPNSSGVLKVGEGSNRYLGREGVCRCLGRGTVCGKTRNTVRDFEDGTFLNMKERTLGKVFTNTETL